MKKLCLAVLVTFIVTTNTLNRPVLAADIANGAKVFRSNCIACHTGGSNVVNASKTLKKDTLEKFDLFSLKAITTQVTNGKNGMPAFKKRLNTEQIEDVAAYILAEAEKGW